MYGVTGIDCTVSVFRQEQEHEKGVTARHTAARERKLMKPSPRDLDTRERQKEV
jgi:hypothetical protein